MVQYSKKVVCIWAHRSNISNYYFFYANEDRAHGSHDGSHDGFCTIGILLWELWTAGKTPYPTFSNSQVLDQVCYLDKREDGRGGWSERVRWE